MGEIGERLGRDEKNATQYLYMRVSKNFITSIFYLMVESYS